MTTLFNIDRHTSTNLKGITMNKETFRAIILVYMARTIDHGSNEAKAWLNKNVGLNRIQEAQLRMSHCSDFKCITLLSESTPQLYTNMQDIEVLSRELDQLVEVIPGNSSFKNIMLKSVKGILGERLVGHVA